LTEILQAGVLDDLQAAPALQDLSLSQVDLPRLDQALVNLIHNVVKITPSAGEVTQMAHGVFLIC
jgi:signal transduction histidine kinase